MAFENDICGWGVEKKKPALGGLGGSLVQIRASNPLTTCGYVAH
jgi:hypothetical protein